MHKTATQWSHLDSLPIPPEKALCLIQIQMVQLEDTQISITCNLCIVQIMQMIGLYPNNFWLLCVNVLKTAIIYPYRINVF